HEVFEVVRQAGSVEVLIGRADLVGHHRRDRRRAGNWFQVNPQAVRQRFGADAFVEGGGRLQGRVVGRGGAERDASKRGATGERRKKCAEDASVHAIPRRVGASGRSALR